MRHVWSPRAIDSIDRPWRSMAVITIGRPFVFCYFPPSSRGCPRGILSKARYLSLVVRSTGERGGGGLGGAPRKFSHPAFGRDRCAGLGYVLLDLQCTLLSWACHTAASHYGVAYMTWLPSSPASQASASAADVPDGTKVPRARTGGRGQGAIEIVLGRNERERGWARLQLSITNTPQRLDGAVWGGGKTPQAAR